ncbi:MAG TPA: chromate resistance protein ChrB domain-containing protein [Candidatus Binatia bacterium]|nr:chromate resistance protein ChrB domain-containing protein [Candidatus Binatia bacterium]
MKWVTRENAVVDRVACPWLIRRFVDREAEFLFVPADQVERVAREQDAIPYDVPGAKLGHVDGRCSFESIVLEYGLGADPALATVAAIVHAADVAGDLDRVPEGRGLKAIAVGFRALCGRDDQRKLALETPVYDALYEWARTREAVHA